MVNTKSQGGVVSQCEDVPSSTGEIILWGVAEIRRQTIPITDCLQTTPACSDAAWRVNTPSHIKHLRTSLTDDNEHLANLVGADRACLSLSLFVSIHVDQ